ncbi:MAG TPA: hypothetical protein VGC26_03505 [Afipia sp.]
MNEPLSAALERFNRKERNLLVQAILGHKERKLQLSDAFRNVVATQLGLATVPQGAWWATDYHLSWLAGALAVLEKGEAAIDRTLPPWSNPKQGTKIEGNVTQLVEGNQEDVDLVIATGLELIMVEAKGFGSFDSCQIQSKLDRIEMLRQFYTVSIKPQRNIVRFHFIFVSPKKPPDFPWPRWALNKSGAIPWICLELGKRLTVERCDSQHNRDADGCHWHVRR